MSIADAVRARELEAKVAALEQRMTQIEGRLDAGSAAGNGAHVMQRINLLQGQINMLRRASGELKTDDAA
jgi:hypothetical protein